MASGSVSKKDSVLRPWGSNFSGKIAADPASYFFTPVQAAELAALFQRYEAALDVLDDPLTKTRAAISEKNVAKAEFRARAMEYVALLQANRSITDAQRISLGVKVHKAEPTPQPAPLFAPLLEVVSVLGLLVTIRLRDSQDPDNRGKPPLVDGAACFSWVGDTPPADTKAWAFEGNTSRTTVRIEFPGDLAPGTRVLLTACWFNERKITGPACQPVPVFLGAGLSSAA